MLFSSMIFLWLFLPCVLILNLILPRGAANWFLIAAGFIFYAWGEQEYIWVLLLSLLVNYLGARLMGKAGESMPRIHLCHPGTAPGIQPGPSGIF